MLHHTLGPGLGLGLAPHQFSTHCTVQSNSGCVTEVAICPRRNRSVPGSITELWTFSDYTLTFFTLRVVIRAERADVDVDRRHLLYGCNSTLALLPLNIMDACDDSSI